MQQIGKHIKETRLKLNLKQQAVADALGISLTAYSNIECGKTENISLQRLKQVADVLQTDISALLHTAPGEDDPLILALKGELQETKEELNNANKQIEFLRGG